MNEKINCGSEELIPKSEWVTPQDLEGELKVLNSPLMEKAFQKILTKFIPTHNVAFLSLCTATRPYSKSRKWNVYNNYFGDKCDLIVTSNGGVIPQPFWECYPYMTYDAYSHEDNGLYNKVLLRRLVEFFTKFDSYDTIIFNFNSFIRLLKQYKFRYAITSAHAHNITFEIRLNYRTCILYMTKFDNGVNVMIYDIDTIAKG